MQFKLAHERAPVDTLCCWYCCCFLTRWQDNKGENEETCVFVFVCMLQLCTRISVLFSSSVLATVSISGALAALVATTISPLGGSGENEGKGRMARMGRDVIDTSPLFASFPSLWVASLGKRKEASRGCLCVLHVRRESPLDQN